MADIDPFKDHERRANSAMVEAGRLAKQGPKEAWQTGTSIDYWNNDQNTKDQRVTDYAKEAKREQDIHKAIRGSIHTGEASKKVSTTMSGGLEK